MQAIFGFQVIVLFFACTGAASDLLGTPTIVSLFIGFILSSIIIGILSFFAMAAFYTITGLYFVIGLIIAAQGFGLDGGSSFIIGLVSAGIGWAANKPFWGQAHLDRLREKEARRAAEYEANPSKGHLKSENREEMFAAAAAGYRTGLIPDEIYERMCSEIKAYTTKTMQSEPEPIATLTIKDPKKLDEEDKMALVELSEVHLIREAESEVIFEKMDSILYNGLMPNVAPEQDQNADYVGVPYDLNDLMECRAIDMQIYLTVMLKVDEDFDPLLATWNRFPDLDPKPEAEKSAKSLYKLGLINVETYRDAVFKIDERRKSMCKRA